MNNPRAIAKSYIRVLSALVIIVLGACTPFGELRIAGDRGIGGTGISGDDRGIGGTGIVGTITGFGSIFVNGFEVEFPQAATVTSNGRSRDTQDLKIGQVVALIAVERDGQLGTDSIEIQPAVVGPLQQSSEGGTIIVVAGQEVVLDPAAGPLDVAAGAWLEVNGLRDSQGRILASRVDRAEAGVAVVRGIAREAAPGRFAVGGLTIVSDGPVQNGSAVVVTGPLSELGLVASSITVEPEVPFGGRVGVVSIEGIVSGDLDQDDFRVGRYAIQSLQSQVRGAAEAVPGARVSILGRAVLGRAIVVDSIQRSGIGAPRRSLDDVRTLHREQQAARETARDALRDATATRATDRPSSSDALLLRQSEAAQRAVTDAVARRDGGANAAGPRGGAGSGAAPTQPPADVPTALETSPPPQPTVEPTVGDASNSRD
ncbi:MAG: DUF5666 domain-containing protein [Proteobacteria bacterium]|nr:DUF5666 domain-containing protein [Pseudomonadota bacterium]